MPCPLACAWSAMLLPFAGQGTLGPVKGDSLDAGSPYFPTIKHPQD
jgi:hypothetical protein